MARRTRRTRPTMRKGTLTSQALLYIARTTKIEARPGQRIRLYSNRFQPVNVRCAQFSMLCVADGVKGRWSFVVPRKLLGLRVK